MRVESRTIQLVLTTVVVVAMLGTTACGPKRSEIARAAAAEVVETAPGVTDTEVRVGFVVVDQTRLNATLGFESPDSGDREAQIQALADHVNANGGIAGRTLVPVIRVFDALTDSATNEEKLCRSFTEDDRVFAVVLQGMFQDNSRPCYANSQTLMLDQTLFPLDRSASEEFAPYLFQPSLPDYGELLEGLAGSLSANGFFDDDSRLGVIGIDNDQNRRVTEEQLLPRLAELGVEPTDVQWVDPTSNATLQASQNQAVLSFKERGVDRVVVVGGSRLLAFLLTIAIPQEFRPAYAVTTFDNPNFVASGTPEAMADSVGISVLPAWDLNPDQLDFPRNAAEQRCLDIFSEAGQRFAARENARESLEYCDAVTLLADALRDAPTPSAAAFAEGVARLGPIENATNYEALWEPGVVAGHPRSGPWRSTPIARASPSSVPPRAFGDRGRVAESIVDVDRLGDPLHRCGACPHVSRAGPALRGHPRRGPIGGARHRTRRGRLLRHGRAGGRPGRCDRVDPRAGFAPQRGRTARGGVRPAGRPGVDGVVEHR